MTVLGATVDAQARDAVGAFISQSGRIAQHIAVEAMRQLEYAKLLGALPEEVGFDFAINIRAYLK